MDRREFIKSVGVAGSLATMPPFALFRTVAVITGGAGILALLVSPGVKKLMGQVD